MALRASLPEHFGKTNASKKEASRPQSARRPRQIAAGEFKAKCLAIIDEVGRTGQEIIITKRGKPSAKLAPIRGEQRPTIIGRLEGIMKINGDPDDLIKPVFPEAAWDMLK